MSINGYEITRRADLYGADLYAATRGSYTVHTVKAQITGLRWPVIVFDSHIEIGCQAHTADEWVAYSDLDIQEMDPEALEFWTKHKAAILGLA